MAVSNSGIGPRLLLLLLLATTGVAGSAQAAHVRYAFSGTISHIPGDEMGILSAVELGVTRYFGTLTFETDLSLYDTVRYDDPDWYLMLKDEVDVGATGAVSMTGWSDGVSRALTLHSGSDGTVGELRFIESTAFFITARYDDADEPSDFAFVWFTDPTIPSSLPATLSEPWNPDFAAADRGYIAVGFFDGSNRSEFRLILDSIVLVPEPPTIVTAALAAIAVAIRRRPWRLSWEPTLGRRAFRRLPVRR